MSTIISQFFGVDHDRLDRIFQAFVNNMESDYSLAKQFFARFHEGLERHIEWEEQLLFPRFEQATGMVNAGPTLVMVHEHQMILGLLEKISQKLDSEQNCQDEINSLVGLLESHNHKEEQILYRQCDQMIPPAAVDEMLLNLH